ncbi:MAG: sigma-70 family RNA polymerase sigma factor [Kiritimatiellae bacterium]|nr:sigma-70 family RNA polymerase sigma factor [Kiritimatiellia bacterium]
MPTSGAAAGTPTLDGVIREQERPLLRYATRIVRDHAAAQDVVQTAMIRLCRHWAMLSATPARIVPWLYRTVRNAAVDHIRREERRRRATEAMAREVTAPASPSPGPDERRRWVELQLEQLSTGEREVLVLRLEHGLSYRQIADVTGRTVGNVGCLLHNAVRRISAALKARGDL